MFRRPMAFAGSWYPRSPTACEAAIQNFLAEPHSPDAPSGAFGIVPHAGWVFSGGLAARVFRALPAPNAADLVIVLGGHLRPDDPVVAMCEGEWQTPFGPFTIHTGFRAELEQLPRVVFETEARLLPDNSTELQLPFAKYRFPHAELLPLRVPPAPVAMELGRRLADYLARTGLRAVGVASTDLTHYGNQYGFQPQGQGAAAVRWVSTVNDPAFIQAVEAGDGGEIIATALGRRNACSPGAVAALNEVAGARGLRFRPQSHATSAEAGPRDSSNFVGYLGGIYC